MNEAHEFNVCPFTSIFNRELLPLRLRGVTSGNDYRSVEVLRGTPWSQSFAQLAAVRAAQGLAQVSRK